MKRLLGLLLVVGIIGCGKSDLVEQEANDTRVPDRKMAIQSLEKIGGIFVASPNGTVRSLQLYDAQRTDAALVHLKSLTTLKDVSLFLQITDAGLANLSGLKQLTSLRLNGTQITDVGMAHLKKLPHLEQLLISSPRITDAGLVHLSELTNLRELDLYGGTGFQNTAVTEAGLVHLAALTNLTVLNVRPSQITDIYLEHLKGFTRLEKLDLSGTQITDAGLVHLKGMRDLQQLDLMSTKVTDAGLIHLKPLTSLKQLVLDGCTTLTNAGVAELQRALPDCKITK